MAKNIKYRPVFWVFFIFLQNWEFWKQANSFCCLSCSWLEKHFGGYFSINYSWKPNSISSANHTASGYKGWQNKEESRSLRSPGLRWNLSAMESKASGYRPNISTFLLYLLKSKYEPMLFAASLCPPYVCALNALHGMGLWLVELPAWTNTGFHTKDEICSLCYACAKRAFLTAEDFSW